jgi:hypothetical protein
MTKYSTKDYQEACDAGIILCGMFVRVNGTEIFVEEGSRIDGFSGLDKDGEWYEFSDEQVDAITGW